MDPHGMQEHQPNAVPFQGQGIAPIVRYEFSLEFT